MQHSGLRQLSKTALTITGIVLLIIFGTRAASQASSLAAVGGGQIKKASDPISLDAGQFAMLADSSTPLRYAALIGSNPAQSHSPSSTDETTTPTAPYDAVNEINSDLAGPVNDALAIVQTVADSVTGAPTQDISVKLVGPGHRHQQTNTAVQTSDDEDVK